MTRRKAYLKRTYGITEEEYDALLAEQGGVCALCGKRPGKVRVAVDHDHATGRVRGLLHARCNQALGPLEWSDEVLTRTVKYLNKIMEGRATSA